MNPRRLAVFGTVVLLAVILGVLARRYVMEQEPRPEAPSTAQAPAAPATTSPPPVASAPAAPPTPAPEAAPAATRPVFDVVRIEPDGAAVVAGRTTPGAEVELLAGGSVIDRTKANEVGEFVIMPPPLQPGSHELTLKTADAASNQAVSVSVPEPGKGDVLVVVGEPGKPSQVVQAGAPVSPDTGALSTPGSVASPAPADTPLLIGAVESEAGRLFVQGSGPPSARAMIYLNGAPLAEATVGADGKWSLTVNQGLSTGSYTIRVDQMGPDGKVVARAEVPFTTNEPASAAVASIAPAKPPAAPEAAAPSPAPPAASETPTGQANNETQAPETVVPMSPAPQAPASTGAPAMESEPSQPAEKTEAANPVVAQISTLTVKRGDNLWRISRKTYGQGIRYSTIYEANSDQIRDPNRIYPGQVFVMPPG